MSSIQILADEYISGNLSSKFHLTEDMIVDYVEAFSPSSRKSIKGSLFKTKAPGLYSFDSLKKYNAMAPRGISGGGLVFNYSNAEIKPYQSYDCENKQKSRQFIIQAVKKYTETDSPLIGTFASHEGLCVKEFLKAFGPKVGIHNFEVDKVILEKYEKLNLPTANHLGDFREVFQQFPPSPYYELDLMNLDALSYFSRKMADLLSMINKRRNVKVLAITMLYNKNFRNDGDWVDEMKAKFDSFDDPVLEGMKSTLNDNYSYTSGMTYRKTNVGENSRTMRTDIFVRKDLL